MNPTHPPIPTSLRCLAVLPAIIMLGGYALLGPKPAESNVQPGIAATAERHETTIPGLLLVGEKLAVVEHAGRSASR